MSYIDTFLKVNTAKALEFLTLETTHQSLYYIFTAVITRGGRQFKGPGQRRLSTAGENACPKTAKTGLIDLSLAFSIAKLYGFVDFRGVPEVFPGRTDPKVWFGYIAHNLMHCSGEKQLASNAQVGSA
jgi:hypothetical protein